MISLVGVHLDSPTMDEPVHLVRGLSYWWIRDTRLGYAHPPLADALLALPAALLGDRVDLTSFPAWADADTGKLAEQYFTAHWAAARAELVIARHVNVLFSFLLGLYVFRFARRRAGDHAALFALGLHCLHPTLLAHGRLVTTDLPIALATTIAVGEAAEHFERPRLRTAITTTLAVAAAFCIKYSAAFLVPLLVSLGLFFAWRGGAEGDAPTRRARLGRFAAHAFAVTLAAVLAVNAAYGFQRTGWTVARILAEPEPQSYISKRANHRLLEERSPLARLPRWLPVPLPYTYVFGLSMVSVQGRDGHATYFLGQRADGGWAGYFPVMLAIKNPLAVLVLLGVGLARSIRRRAAPDRVAGTLLAACGLYLAISMGSKINIGVRHVLPVVPFFVLGAGTVAAQLWQEGTRRTRTLLALLGAGTFASAIAWYRHPVGYFNALTLGPVFGPKVSVVGEDWGQDMADVAAALKARNLGPVYYHRYGWMMARELEANGIEYERLRCGERPGPGVAVVHAVTRARSPGCHPELFAKAPLLVVNGRLFVYALDAPDRPAAPAPRPRLRFVPPPPPSSASPDDED
ncbi:glycosyltransferase family 39 protein [Polyangium sp. y55x31]|uniref:ArnT family glycosyltransferase n=1 Tax=Polyangium sp. y55x31 TaxID=3042688 RepID=UPI0024828664|nr:glycosyltransferase family 39 protein [Polyangium sp. y55x31]MDI1481364.1 glycosyltransferase family 39 protein [Polyangium sp. y55x31]